MDEVVLELDDSTARDIYEDLSARRRHLENGAPVPRGSPSSWGRLAAVIWDLRHQLGMSQPYNEPRPRAVTGPVTVTLRIDRETARELLYSLYNVGEHHAAGEPIASGGEASERRLDSVLEAVQNRR
jgi:hypothetical protein